MPYTPPKYPAAIPDTTDLPDRVDDIDWLYAARYNELKKELLAALGELGVLPKGSYADVKTRLDDNSKKIKDADGDSYVDVEASTDVDEIVEYVAGSLARKIHSSGIIDNPLQSSCRVYLSTAEESIPTATSEKLLLDSKSYDLQNEFNVSTNRFTATKPGKYLVLGTILWKATIDQAGYTTDLKKNGASEFATKLPASGTTSIWVQALYITDLAANDYIELFAYQSSGSDQIVRGSSINETSIVITKLL